jgi:GTP-binding protein
LQEMKPSGGGKMRLAFRVPARGMIGYHGEFLTDTRGTGIMNRAFESFGPHKGPIRDRHQGVLISNEGGKAAAYALWNLEERGVIMIEPGDEVYQGMIIAEHSRGNDLEVNPMKGKKLTNIRTTSKDEAVTLTPPRKLSLEQAIAYIASDELVEVTPNAIRLRKRHLDPHVRKRAERAAAAEAAQ